MVNIDIAGQIIVYNWTNARVLVGDVVIDTMTSLRCKRTNTKTVGDCEIILADPLSDIYDSIDYLDEIQIYLQDPANLYVANKVWGGWLENKEFIQGNSETMKITGKEYANALFDKYYTNTFSTATDLAEIVNLIATDDGTLDYSEIPAAIGKFLVIDFEKERHWDAIKKSCDAVNFEFGVDLDQKLYVRDKADAPLSSDEVIVGDNFIAAKQDSIGKDFASEVTVQGNSSAVSSTSSNATAETAYRKRQVFAIKPDATDALTTADYADSILGNQSSLIKRYRVGSVFLPYTNPNDNIEVSVENTDLTTNYKVIEIEHSVTQKGGMQSSLTLNSLGSETNDVLSNLLKNYYRSEKQVWA